tara:strand:+ start:9525 stop:11036 length:1512 start_codon:yes stop_codon:yes gene_type:complete
MAIKESDIKGLMKVVMSSTMKTVAAGQKTVISPTEVRNIAIQITKDATSGSITRFENALAQTEKVLDKLDIDLRDFNSGLAKTLKEAQVQRDDKIKEVETLRASNIVAEVKADKQGREFMYETHILTKKEIAERTELLQKNKSLAEDREKKIIARMDELLSQEKLSNDDRQEIIEGEKQIQADKLKIEREDKTLNPLKPDGDTGFGPSSTFYEELKAPFIAVGDAFMAIGDLGKDIMKIGKFFADGGLMKGLKGFKKGIMAIGKFLMGTKVLIGLAIAGVIAGIVYFKDELMAIGKFIVGIPGFIMKGLTKVFTMYTDFYKTMINAVIKLINKIPGVNIGLLETSTMKKEREEGEKQERIKKGAADFTGDVEANTQSGFVDKGGYLEPIREQDNGFSDNAGMGNEQSNVVYDKGTKSAIMMNRQVVGNQLRGSGATGTGDASTAKTLFQEQKQAKMYDTGEVPPVILNNTNQSSVNSSGSTTVGFVQNKNVDDTFTNLNYVMP